MSKTILVVEDSPVVASLLELVLRQLELESIVTDTFRKARKEMKGGQRPDGLVIDLDLPAATGWRLLREMMADPDLRSVPRILLTSRAVPDDEIALLSDGISACVDKHEFDLKDFEALVKRLFVSGRDG